MRFLLPYALPVIAILLAFAYRRFSPCFHSTLIAVLVALSAYHLLCDTDASETLSHLGRKDLLHRVISYNRFNARLGYWGEALAPPETLRIIEAEQLKPKRVIMIQEAGDVPLFWYFGDNLQWQVTAICASDSAPRVLERTPADLVAVLFRRHGQPSERSQALLAQRGWMLQTHTNYFDLYQRGRPTEHI
jgi:hypothetical protein